ALHWHALGSRFLMFQVDRSSTTPPFSRAVRLASRMSSKGTLLAGWTVLHTGGACRLTPGLPLCGDPRTTLLVQRHDMGPDATAESNAWLRGAWRSMAGIMAHCYLLPVPVSGSRLDARFWSSIPR